MTDKEYKLTISIMASNRKDTLPKTLESIKPILDNVSSELIITDTGCDDELLDVIRTYTDKIVKFQWCNDFAKARNVGLKMAQGEWFMFVDDDEWFEDVTPIIDFFNNGECEKYNSFDYAARNYWDMEGKIYRDTPVGRGVRLIRNIEFVGKIHESFSQEMHPKKIIGAYVHHYGYAYNSQEERMAHSQRNMSLLKSQIEEGCHEMRNYVHLAQEYNNLEQYEDSLETTLRGIEKATEAQEENPRYMGALKANVIFTLMKLKRYEELIGKADMYIREGGISLSAVCVINGYRTHGWFELGDSHKLIDSAREYFGLYRYIKGVNGLAEAETVLTVGAAFDKVMPNVVYNISLMAAMLIGDMETIKRSKEWYECVECFEPIDDGVWLADKVEVLEKRLTDVENYDTNEIDCIIDRYIHPLSVYMQNVVCATKICDRILAVRERNQQVFKILVLKLDEQGIQSPHLKLLKTICGM